MPVAKCLRRLLSFGVALFLVGWTLGPLSRPLTGQEMEAARGGVDCYVDGTGNCPAPTTLCSTTSCTGVIATCPGGTTGQTQALTTFQNVELTNDPGKVGKTNLTAVNCINLINCTGCNFLRKCSNGNAYGQSTSRVPTRVNQTSAACPVP
jgi:hypothetical protein